MYQNIEHVERFQKSFPRMEFSEWNISKNRLIVNSIVRENLILQGTRDSNFTVKECQT